MSFRWRVCAVVFGAIALVIAGSAWAATLAMVHGGSSSWRIAFSVMCHGLPERSLHINGVAMPICARCLGAYAGIVAGIVTARFLRRDRLELSAMHVLAALTPMAVDGITQALGLRTSSNGLRLITGGLAAMVFLSWVMQRIESADEEDAERDRYLKNQTPA